MNEHEWITVREAAERLGTSEEMVRQHIRADRLFAKRSGPGSRSAWLVDAGQVAAEAELRDMKARLRGVVTGYDTQAFVEEVRARHGAEAGDAVAMVIDRHALLEVAARAVDESRGELGLAFDDLDDEEAIEREAQAIAARIRRAERIRRRALEILDEQDE